MTDDLSIMELGTRVLNQTMEEWAADRVYPPVGLALQRVSDIETERIDWLWQRWVPMRMLTLLGGHGGDGKSTVMADLIAAWTTGRSMPDGSEGAAMNVLMLSAEDDPGSAIRPRLDLHGADTSRILILRGTRRADGKERWFDLRRDVQLMDDVVARAGIGLVVIDPLSSYLTGRDRNSEGDIRDAMQPLMGLIDRNGCAVVGIMHVGKGSGGRRASQRLLGSTAFTALARSVVMLADAPDERQPDDIATAGKLKVLQVVKSNHSIPPAPIQFRRPLDEAIQWLGPSEVTIEECLATTTARERGRTATERNEAVDFLLEVLASGDVPAAEILTQARAQGFSERTLRRAKAKLGIRAIRNPDRTWLWSLPNADAEDEHTAHADDGPPPIGETVEAAPKRRTGTRSRARTTAN